MTKTTHLKLPDHVRRLAGMAAASNQQTLTEYVSGLILTDAATTGLDTLIIAQAPPSEMKEEK